MKTVGTLFGIGVGPGDPELLTLKAVRMINQADVIFTAASTKNSYSLAVEIARPHIAKQATIRSLSFTMSRDKAKAREAWDNNARTIAEVLEQGKNAAFLTLGDPMTYSTYGYVLKSLTAVMPHAVIETVPGITSFHAAAARLNRTLVEAEESLLISSGAYGGEPLRKSMDGVENVVLLKAYKNTADINTALRGAGLFENGVAISKCGREGEEIIDNLGELETRDPNYWTLILAGK